MSNVSPIGRLSFPNLFKASQINGEGEAKFSCTLIFEPNDPGLIVMREAVADMILKKWNGKVPPNFKDPILDGDDMENRPEYHDKIVIRFASKEAKRPQLVRADKSVITDQDELYSGCYCRVSYSVYSWSYMGKSGISFGLGHVQKIRNGERLDGRGNADQVFDAVEAVADDLF